MFFEKIIGGIWTAECDLLDTVLCWMKLERIKNIFNYKFIGKVAKLLPTSLMKKIKFKNFFSFKKT